MQVRKEYSKCFRHTYCCGGLPTESSHGSVKTSTTRTSARYSSGTQVDNQLPEVKALETENSTQHCTQPTHTRSHTHHAALYVATEG